MQSVLLSIAAALPIEEGAYAGLESAQRVQLLQERADELMETQTGFSYEDLLTLEQ